MDNNHDNDNDNNLDPNNDPNNDPKHDHKHDPHPHHHHHQLNQLTLAMFSNKGMYKRHLEKSDPELHAKRCEYLDKIAKYRKKMRTLTMEFLEDPEKDFNTEVNEMFEGFAKTLIRYLEMKEIDQDTGGCYENNDEDDENMLFATSKMNHDNDDIESANTTKSKYYSKNRLANFFGK
jgi:hypothetical protein